MAGPSTKDPSPYDAPRDMLRSDMPDGYAPESRKPAPPSRYPLLRAMRWILRVGALLYLLASLVRAVSMFGLFDTEPSGRSDERSVIYPAGSRDTDHMQGYRLLAGVAALQSLVYSVALLALAEAIQLGLDIRAEQQRPVR